MQAPANVTDSIGFSAYIVNASDVSGRQENAAFRLIDFIYFAPQTYLSLSNMVIKGPDD
jgi:hypothetical protein